MGPVPPGSDSTKSRRPFQLWFDSTYKVHQISHSPKSTVIEGVKSKFKQCMYVFEKIAIVVVCDIYQLCYFINPTCQKSPLCHT